MLRGDLLTIVTAPVIYSLVVPFVIIDLVGFDLSGGVLSRLGGSTRAPPRLSSRSIATNCRYLNGLEKAELRVLQLRQRLGRVRARSGGADRAVLVSDPTWETQSGSSHERYADFVAYGDGAAYRSTA